MDSLALTLDFLQDYGLLALLVLMAVDNLNVPFVLSEPVLLYGGYLVERGDHNPAAVVACVLTGTMLGVMISYAIGRYGGRTYLERHGRWLGVTDRRLHAADDWFERYGDRAVFLGRMVPVLRTFISLPAGVAEMPARRFAIFSLLGAAAWTAIMGGIGFALARQVDDFGSLLTKAAPFVGPLKYGLLGTAVLVFIVLVVRYRRRRATTAAS